MCIGSNLESRVVLEGLIAGGAQIAGLVTLPGCSSAVSDHVDLHPLCEEHGIETIDTTDINSWPTIKAIGRLEPDYLYTLGWSQLFGDELLSVPARYVVGSHPSPLPEGRGRAPVGEKSFLPAPLKHSVKSGLPVHPLSNSHCGRVATVMGEESS